MVYGTIIKCRYAFWGIQVSQSRSNQRSRSNFRYWALTFECLDLETSFLVCRYIFMTSSSDSYMKVIGSRSQVKVKIIIFSSAGGWPSIEGPSCYNYLHTHSISVYLYTCEIYIRKFELNICRTITSYCIRYRYSDCLLHTYNYHLHIDGFVSLRLCMTFIFPYICSFART